MRRIFFCLVLVLLGRSATAAETQPIVIRDVTVIDATGAAPKPRMTVVVSGHRIAAVGPSGGSEVPATAKVIDGSGKFLIPGLWDMHVHLSKAGSNTLPLFLAHGVTSVRDMGGDVESLTRWKQEIGEGTRLGPRIKLAGPMLETADKIDQMRRDRGVEPFERFRIGIGAPEEAEAVVEQLARKGVDFLKIRSVVSVEAYQAIAAAGRKHGLSLVGHPVAPPEEILRAGQGSIEHGFYPPLEGRSAEQRRELFRQFRLKNISIVPTFAVGQAMLIPYAKMKAIIEDQEGQMEPRRKYLHGYLIEDWKEQAEEQKEPWPGLRAYLETQRRDLREMFEAGVRILPGTDTAVLLVWPGASLHDELKTFVHEIGMTPMQAIVSATRSPAEFFGLQDTLGTIEIGKLADLVLLDRNPVEDIANLSRIAAVIRDGRFFGATEIETMLAAVAGQPAKP